MVTTGIGLITWRSEKRFRRCLLDVKELRGADTAGDHQLVRCKIRLNLARNKKKQTSRSIHDTAKLKYLLHQWNFSIDLKNHFEALDSEYLSVDDAWIEYRDIYRSTAAKCLGQRARTRKDWLSIAEKRKLKHILMNCQPQRVKEKRQQIYQIKHKEVKKRTRTDKTRILERIEEEAERAAHQNNLKELYRKRSYYVDTSRSQTLGYGIMMGKSSPQRKKWLERLKEHFYEVLSEACEETDFPEGCQLDNREEPIR
ncbi:uncharacterized protein LOC144650349 [Oculina patagonica]